MADRFVIVDIGCIECGESTEVRGFYDSHDEAITALIEAAKDREIGGPELKYLDETSTFIAGFDYFSTGQHSMELHVFPPRAVKSKG